MKNVEPSTETRCETTRKMLKTPKNAGVTWTYYHQWYHLRNFEETRRNVKAAHFLEQVEEEE